MLVHKQVVGAGLLKIAGQFYRLGDTLCLESSAFERLPQEKQARLQDAAVKDDTSQPNPCGGDASAGVQATGCAKDGHSPLEGEQLHQNLIHAIAGLDRSNDALWTKGDERKPLTDALSALIGQSISATQRDNAWAEVMAVTTPNNQGAQ
ncbi:hypothetical protein [Shewanella xiamenensis]|uniref:hypothetical protein n=1 Tax=Shewanella xiamenensis TaxID=332186 RepID=UPI000849CF63|nr:hypothetical protein [Shewanella xiamenensis]ODR86712.1 hypothetical protein ABT47_16075 [Shewanella xiamenensis]